MINEKCGNLTIVIVILWLVGLFWTTPVIWHFYKIIWYGLYNLVLSWRESNKNVDVYFSGHDAFIK